MEIILYYLTIIGIIGMVIIWGGYLYTAVVFIGRGNLEKYDDVTNDTYLGIANKKVFLEIQLDFKMSKLLDEGPSWLFPFHTIVNQNRVVIGISSKFLAEVKEDIVKKTLEYFIFLALVMEQKKVKIAGKILYLGNIAICVLLAVIAYISDSVYMTAMAMSIFSWSTLWSYSLYRYKIVDRGLAKILMVNGFTKEDIDDIYSEIGKFKGEKEHRKTKNYKSIMRMFER